MQPCLNSVSGLWSIFYWLRRPRTLVSNSLTQGEKAPEIKSRAVCLQDRRSESVAGSPATVTVRVTPTDTGPPLIWSSALSKQGPPAQRGISLFRGTFLSVRSPPGLILVHIMPGHCPWRPRAQSAHPVGDAKQEEKQTYLTGQCRCPCLRSVLCSAYQPGCCVLWEARKPGHPAIQINCAHFMMASEDRRERT